MVRCEFPLFALSRLTKLLYWLLRSRIGLLLFWSIHYFLELENVVLTFWQKANKKVHIWMMMRWLKYWLHLTQTGTWTWKHHFMDDCLRPLINVFKDWTFLQERWVSWVETNVRSC